MKFYILLGKGLKLRERTSDAKYTKDFTKLDYLFFQKLIGTILLYSSLTNEFYFKCIYT